MKRSTEINGEKVRIKMEDVEELSTDADAEESNRKKFKVETDDEDEEMIKAETDDEGDSISNVDVTNSTGGDEEKVRDTACSSSRKERPKNQKPNAVVDLSNAAAIIASFSDSFYGLCKLREVSKAFNQGVLQSKTYRITTEDIRVGRHVAALHYVCRFAEGKTILLDPGNYDLEARFCKIEYQSDDDIGKWDNSIELIEGMRFDKYVDTWKPGKGSLRIEAKGVSLCSSVPSRPASINFFSDIWKREEDPLIHIALVVKAKGVKLHGISTAGGLSMYVDGHSISARNCIFGGTVTLRRCNATLKDCVIRYGQYGGVSSDGYLTITRCRFFDNAPDVLIPEGDFGVDFRGGKATFRDTFIQCIDEKDARFIFNEEQHFEPFYDSDKNEWLIRLKDRGKRT